MRLCRSATILALALLCVGIPVSSSDFYEWTDENGVTHFATSLEEVPAQYRDRVKRPDGRPVAKPSAVKTEAPPAAALPVPAAPGTAGSEPDRFEVPYQPLEGSAQRVIVPVTLNRTMTAKMALDTGAPGMVISFALASKLGVLSGDGGALFVEAGGIGGTAPAILTVIDSVSIGRAKTSFVPTTVTFPISEAFEGLIGMDFMSDYTTTIDPRKKVVVFTQHPADPNTRGGHGEDWWRKTFHDFNAARDLWFEYARSNQGKLGARTQAIVDFQVQESQRLLRKLDVYASNNAVPRHWR